MIMESQKPVAINDINKDRNLILALKAKLGISKVQNAMIIPIKNAGSVDEIVILINK